MNELQTIYEDAFAENDRAKKYNAKSALIFLPIHFFAQNPLMNTCLRIFNEPAEI